ncbi:hypothetical protein CONPUDRAFT_70519 [Coniophora puteana RWD-64-598 SS2]|uniref:G-protein coupled receptors family 1 profile domain-containing protein n=1 Tax=Coniophora puteana (strain RWD-64-598) TaxID=741705 RepID=A0A5M3N379_CONPW|nr:uncharacterized protein CONPUDRAFT_70519 [Coniophora puteana RWD-64-598 SS2]EIW85818.1 hypothetical protein CONPUDRAFT_70519 [Coniophora puteana RWD-64-598 SS2]
MAVGSFAAALVDESRYALILSYGGVALLATVFYDYSLHASLSYGTQWLILGRSTIIPVDDSMIEQEVHMRYLGVMFALCKRLFITTMATKAILLLLVQGLMAHRVHVLYRPARTISTLLVVLFVASQVSALASLTFITEQETRADLFVGKAYCPVPQYKLSREDEWMSALNVSVPIFFEIVLCILALYRWFTRLRSARRQSRQRLVYDLLATLLRDNIVYFVIALICLCISSKWAMPKSEVGALNAAAAWYINFLYAGQVVMFSLCGPRMILNIRQFCIEDSGVVRNTTEESYDRQLTTVVLDFLSGSTRIGGA